MRRTLALSAGAVIAVLLAIATWLAIVPNLAVAKLESQLRQHMSRGFEVTGGAHLSFAPLAFTFEQVRLAGPEGMEGNLATARSLSVPIGLAQLVGGELLLTALTLEGADIALFVDERDRAGWDFGGVLPKSPLAIRLASSAIRYFDARNGQSLRLRDVNGDLAIAPDGKVSFAGSSDLNGRLARFNVEIRSLARVTADGSPLTLTFATPELSANFEGRLATAKVLSLDGPIDIDIANLRQVARWAGLAVAEGNSFGAVTLSGALGSSGRAYAIRQANIAIDTTTVYGELVLDTRRPVPKLQAKLSTPNFTLDGFLPSSGTRPGAWGRAPLGFAILRQFDTEIVLDTPALNYASLKDQPARLSATIANGKFDGALTLRPENGARLGFTVMIDGTAAVPSFALGLNAEAADAKELMTGLLGQDWLSGAGTFAVSLSGSGQTQEEIVGTLKGTASLSLADGAVAGLDVPAGLGQASLRILDTWPGGASARTSFKTLAAEFTIADGIAAASNLKLDGTGIALTATGDIDLLRRALDLRADPRLIGADGTSAGLPVKLVVSGPWGSPRIYPDIEGLPGDPAKGFAALKAMGAATGN
jgi:AsmA protein